MLAEQAPPAGQNEVAVTEAARTAEGGRADTLGDVLGPVLNFEKGDVEFWLLALQLLVLILIWREVR